MEMGAGAVATGAHIANNLTLFHIGTCTNRQAAHMGIGSLQAKVMANANITTIATIPTGLLYITGGRSVNGSSVIISNINAGMPGVIIASKGIGATTKIGGNLPTGSRPLAGSHFTAIVFAFNSAQKVF